MSRNAAKVPGAPCARRLRPSALLACIAGVSALVALPAAAQAASRPVAASGAPEIAGRPLAEHSSFCSKVSASSVSAIVGWSVPAGTPESDTEKPTAKNDEIGSTETDCIYGSETSLASLPKLIILGIGTTTKPITPAVVQRIIEGTQSAAGANLHVKFTPYSGLGMTAWYVTFTDAQFKIREIVGVEGTHLFDSASFSSAVSQSKLAALARLAEQL